MSKKYEVDLSEKEWRQRLTPEQFEITRQGGTERPFTGAYWDTDHPGTYRCIGCDTPLFRSETKYDSGTGWPSFWEPISDDVVELREDLSHGMRRIEVLCARCGAHLGHRFPDGPEPTGLRYCLNSAALNLKEEEGGGGEGAGTEKAGAEGGGPEQSRQGGQGGGGV